MVIKKIEIRPKGTGNYADILYPKTSADMVVDEATGKTVATRLAEFVQQLSANGYQKLPNGLIIQWVNVPTNTLTASGGGGLTVALPITFPNGVFGSWVSMQAGSASDTQRIVGNLTSGNSALLVIVNTPNSLFDRALQCLAIGW